MNQVVTLSPTQKSARFESSYCTSHISLALQPNGDLFFLNCYIPGIFIHTDISTKIYTYSLTHELAQLYVDFSNYMYFRELMDLARYAHIFKLRLNNEVIQGLEGVTSSWTGYISLNLVLFKVFC